MVEVSYFILVEVLKARKLNMLENSLSVHLIQ